jgi:hypothetical protein
LLRNGNNELKNAKEKEAKDNLINQVPAEPMPEIGIHLALKRKNESRFLARTTFLLVRIKCSFAH